MPRKSARLLSKSKLQPHNTGSDDFQQKRRRMEDVEESNFVPTSRKQQFRIQNNQLPISGTDAVTSSMIVQSDSDENDSAPRLLLPMPQQFATSNKGEDDEIVHVFTNPPQRRQLFRFSNHTQDMMISFIPLPHMDWAAREDLWHTMKGKEKKYLHSLDMFQRHPDVKPSMRAVLFAWLTEVCEVYKLHKETYYLAVEYVDRFLLATTNIKTTQLQLLGVTALFVAAKYEEIYPPKSAEFVFVADGAFEVENLHVFELMMIKALKWLLSPMTPNAWMQLYLQIAAQQEKKKPDMSDSSSDVTSFYQNTVAGFRRDLDDSASLESANRHSNYDLRTSKSSRDFQRNSYCDTDTIGHRKVLGNSNFNRGTTAPPQTYSGGSPCDLDSSTNSGVSDLVASASVINIAESENTRGSVHLPPGNDFDTDTAEETDEEEEDQEMQEEESIVYPMYSQFVYLQVSRLLDLAVLDCYSLHFKYSVLAAAAVYLTTDIDNICGVTCLTWEELGLCIQWMRIHKGIIDKFQPWAAPVKSFKDVCDSEAPLIQYNSITKEMWEEALKHSEEFFKKQSNLDLLAEVAKQRQRCPSPDVGMPNFITPPRSTKKLVPESGLRQ